MAARGKRHPGSGAFTLLELILVMLILSVVLGMAGPDLRGFFASREIRDAAAQIVSLTQLARSQAACDGTAYRINLDDRNSTYWLTVRKKGAYQKLATEFGRVFYLPKDTIMEIEDLPKENDGTYYIEFTPVGSTTAGAIKLTDRSGRQLYVTCESATETFAAMSSGDYIRNDQRY